MWLKRKWILLWQASGSQYGLIGWIIALAKPMFSILGAVGDMDFLAQSWKALGRFLETGWGTTASVLVGAIILGYSIHRVANKVEKLPAAPGVRHKPISDVIPCALIGLAKTASHSIRDKIIVEFPKPQIRFAPDAVEPYIDIYFTLVNASVHEIVLERVDGLLWYLGHPLRMRPEILSTPDFRVASGWGSTVFLRQSLSTDASRKIAESISIGKNPELDAEHLTLIFRYHDYSGDEKLEVRTSKQYLLHDANWILV